MGHNAQNIKSSSAAERLRQATELNRRRLGIGQTVPINQPGPTPIGKLLPAVLKQSRIVRDLSRSTARRIA